MDTKLFAFEQEIKILSKISHKNVVKYLGAVKTKDGCLQIILEYCVGGSILKMLEQFKTLPETIIKKYTRQILEGLEFLHFNNIIHRDIKGGNILVDRDGNVRLTDFGGAKIIAEELEFQNYKSLKGTPNWMAPEVLKTGEYTRYSDIWSLGCTVYEMITGEPPWSELKNTYATLYHIMNATKPPILPENISDDLKDFLTQCFKIEAKERPNVSLLLQHSFVKEEIKKTSLLINYQTSHHNSLKEPCTINSKLNDVNSDLVNNNKNISSLAKKLGNAFSMKNINTGIKDTNKSPNIQVISPISGELIFDNKFTSNII